MAKFEIGSGLSDYIKQLEKLDDKADGCIKRAVWEGARVLLDEIDQRIDNIPSNVANDDQRQALHDALGSGKMKQGGVASWSNKIGVDGYYNGGYKNNNWNSVSFLANRIQGGTSKTNAFPFVKMAVNSARSKAEKAMQDRLESDIQKLTK